MLKVFGSSIWDRRPFLAALDEAFAQSGAAERVVAVDALAIWREQYVAVIGELVGAERLASGRVPLGAVDWTEAEARHAAACSAELERYVTAASAAGRHALIVGDELDRLSDVPGMAKHLFFVKSDVAQACIAYNARVRAAASGAEFPAMEDAAAGAYDPRFYSFLAEAVHGGGPEAHWPANVDDAAATEASAAIRANERSALVETARATAREIAAHIAERAAPVLDLAALRENARARALLEQIVVIMRWCGASWHDGFNEAVDALMKREVLTIADIAASPVGQVLGYITGR